MPNLENLKKQAKQYLRWHRDGYYPVAAQIRSALPRYRDLTDRQVMASSFKLSDAQELIARKLAFESWEALRRGIQSMSSTDAQQFSRPVLLAAEPQLFVSDVGASCNFYTKKLGFVVAFTYGDPPFYGQVARDSARLNLRCMPMPIIDAQLRDKEDLLSASITIDDAKTAIPRISSRRRRFPPDAPHGALGRTHLHCPRSGWKPDPLRGTR